MIAIVDYGVGNLFSLRCSLRAIGAESLITGRREDIEAASAVILPGVGAFGDAAAKLEASGLAEVVKDEASRGKPLLGVCLGMQLLFDRSFEFGEHRGLGLIGGDVIDMRGRIPAELKIPQIGWNALRFPEGREKSPLFKYINEGDFVYFVHSFYASNCAANTIATTDYGAELTAAAACGSVYGCQFHPEKSGNVGLAILRAFCEMGEGKC